MDCPLESSERSAPIRRICFVVEALGAGGAERVISLLASRWAAAGWDVAICSFDHPSDPVYHPLDPRVRLLRIGDASRPSGRPARLLSLARRISRLRRTLLNDRPDAVLSFLTKINVLTLAASLGTQLRIVVSERNNPARQNAHPLWNMGLRLLLRRANAIVAQTRRAADRGGTGRRNSIRVIPNPVAAPLAHPAVYDAEGPLRIVAVGRLTAQKGFDLLIDAFAPIARRHPRWSLDIWGHGDERASLADKISRAGMTDRISLRGVSAMQGGWAEGASAFVLSSRYEGFPNVLGEAMACGLPVVAFDCPFGPGELVCDGEDGLLVPDQNVPALGEALDRLMGDTRLRQRLGERAAISMRRLNPDQIARQWERMIDDLVGPASALPAPAPKLAGAMRP